MVEFSLKFSHVFLIICASIIRRVTLADLDRARLASFCNVIFSLAKAKIVRCGHDLVDPHVSAASAEDTTSGLKDCRESAIFARFDI
jgi:hypothetical protein